MPDLGEIVRAVRHKYLRTRRTTPFQRKALNAIGRCRTWQMGSTYARCERCGVEHLRFRSCQNRHCPRCQAGARVQWLEAREEELLPVPYFHVVFTVPEVLNDIALYCPEVFYSALLQSAGHAVLDVGMAKLGAVLGCMTILHTWGQNLSLHPHAHCVVPGGGFSPNGEQWIAVRNPAFLLPVKVLSRRFRTLLCNALRDAAKAGKLERLPKEVPPHLTIENAGAQEWIVYAKRPFGGPEQVLRYLSNYTHRVAISNRRIVAFRDDRVTFQWRDYADGNRSKQMTLEDVEFVRRFLMHVLPDRFVRIRYFGFLTNKKRACNIKHARGLLGEKGPCFADRPRPPVLCPACWAAVSVNRASSRPPPEVAA